MILSKRNIYILLFAYITVLILIYSSINFDRINYLVNDVRYSILEKRESTHSKDNFKIIDVPVSKFIKPYKNLPDDFIQFGNLLFYKAKKGNTVKEAARKSILYTQFYKVNKLKNAIMNYNGMRDETLKTDMLLYIPYSIPSIIPGMKNRNKPGLVFTQGLYFTGNSAGSDNFINTIPALKGMGINTVVFDAKDVSGEVTYISRVPAARKYNTDEKYTIDNIDRLIRVLKQQGIYTIARIAVFRDELLCKRDPGLAIRSKRTGGIWNLDAKGIWCDPTNKNVQDYNIGLALELAEKGVDEIQFDYVRFPTKGDLQDAMYSYNYGKISKEDTLAQFLKRAYPEISGRNTLLSIDIFGVVAWQKEIDIKKTGQRINVISKYCDVISPMLYPSHFEDDFDGYPNPADEPYYFIYEGTRKARLLANGKPVRPWLQAFKMRVSPENYNQDYMLKQISACKDSGASGFLFWHSSNSYDVVYGALCRLYAERNGNNGIIK